MALERNRVLGMLPASVRDRLDSSLEPFRLEAGRVLAGSGDQFNYVYFPLSGLCTVLFYADDGSSLEVAAIGNDGLVGLPAVLSDGIAFGETVVQIPGDALRVSAPELRAQLAASTELRSALMRYAQAFINQMTQSCACNGLHSTVQRSARWILMTHDRVNSDEFELSQASLARMLGVGRPTVTIATGLLRDAGLVRFSRGQLSVLDRSGLEAASCSCYASLAAESERLLSAGGTSLPLTP